MGELTFKNKRRRRSLNFDMLLAVLKWVFQIAIVCLLAYVLVWYYGQKVSVVGASMSPSLVNGDVTLVDRLSYKLGSPKRGQLIAFYPDGNKKSYCYIRRIIGLPGETVELRDGSIYINGKKIEEKYEVSELTEEGRVEEAITLADDEYFVLGDNRELLDDSRGDEIGNVKRSTIEGKVWFAVSPREHFGFVR